MFRPTWIVELAVISCGLGAYMSGGVAARPLGSRAIGADSGKPGDPGSQMASQWLSSAISKGDLPAVERLVGAGANVNQTDSVGSTPVMVAVLARRVEIASFLLERGADPNARQRQTGATALLYAISENRADLVQTLLAHGADVTLRYRDGDTVLHVAAERGNGALVELLTAAHVNSDILNEKGDTPLDEAVLHGRSEAVATLLRAHADARRVHAEDGRGPLEEACIKGYGALIPLLVEAGADPSRQDRSGQTPLDLALDYHNLGAVKTLLGLTPGHAEVQDDFESAMESAVVRGRTARAALLLNAGWAATRGTRDGSHYLNDAALKGQLNVVRLLLDHGAAANARNQNGGSALHDAATGGDTAVIALLLDRGAAIDGRETATGATPLMLAASLAHTEAVSLLLARGADYALRDKTGRTALERARAIEEPGLVKLLEKAAEKPGGGQARTG